ncbi:hypothetical protein ANCDUO_15803 [Ancylostoma duodenale]|uniref:Uncharacterized protein n=1 Tax=Ancylostoma duodenale TaxID=51022 RepID=A0A0C2CW04_9BILA|nr:hypothetical protein ANCDUO_15803 [Ancylostoma duodenale]
MSTTTDMSFRDDGAGKNGPSPSISLDLKNAVEEVNRTKGVPKCVKKVLTSFAEQLSSLSLAFDRVSSERDRLALENQNLRNRLRQFEAESDRSPPKKLTNRSSSQPHASNDYHENERLRSIVISGIPEHSGRISNRMNYDFESVCNVLFHIGVECWPTNVYRLGKRDPGRNRAVTVILPSTRFQRVAVSKAHRLRTFSEKGIFLRASLPRAERERLKELRLNLSEKLRKPNFVFDRSVDSSANPISKGSVDSSTNSNLQGN